MLLVGHCKILHKHDFSFSWGHFNSPEKLKTMLMQNFGVTNKEYYGMLWHFLYWSILVNIDHYWDVRVYVTFLRVHGPMGSTPGWNSQLLVSVLLSKHIILFQYYLMLHKLA